MTVEELMTLLAEYDPNTCVMIGAPDNDSEWDMQNVEPRTLDNGDVYAVLIPGN